MNDDVFLFQKLSASDIGSPLTGPVFRIQNDLKVEGAAGGSVGDREGEWPSLRYSNYLLGELTDFRTSVFSFDYSNSVIIIRCKIWKTTSTLSNSYR